MSHPLPNIEERPPEGEGANSEVFPPPGRPGNPKRNRGAIVLAAVVLAVLGYIGVKPRIAQSSKLAAEVATLKTEMPVVSVVTLHKVPDSSEVTLPSNLYAIEQTTIDARTSGYVQARYVDIGSRVKQGQVLADIESPEVDQQLIQSQSEVSRARAGVGQAIADVSRQSAAIAAAQSQVSEYMANVGQTRADLKHLQAKALEASAAIDVARSHLTQTEKRLDVAKAQLARANSAENIASKTLARWKQLFKADAVSGQDVDEKQADYDESVAAVAGANAGVSSAQADVQASQENVQSAIAEYQAAEADVTSGREKVSAARSAVESGQSNVRAAVAAKQASESNVGMAHAQVGSNEATAQRYQALTAFEHVTAPFSGVITARNVDVGDLVNAATNGSGASDPMNTVTKRGLFGLARTDKLLAQANVPEDSVSSIKQGQTADVTTREYPGRIFLGIVSLVSGALDAVSRTELVEVSIANPRNLLKPGMFAEIRFNGSAKTSTVVIPATGLMFDAKGTRVVIVRDGNILHFVPVKLGRDNGGTIEVLEGLNGDEELVTNPDDSLTEGEKVKPLTKQP